MTDAQAFIERILAEPKNLLHQQVFADWLEERGDPRAGWLRVVGQTLREVGPVRLRPDCTLEAAQEEGRRRGWIRRSRNHPQPPGPYFVWPNLRLRDLVPVTRTYLPGLYVRRLVRRSALLRLYGMVVAWDGFTLLTGREYQGSSPALPQAAPAFMVLVRYLLYACRLAGWRCRDALGEPSKAGEITPLDCALRRLRVLRAGDAGRSVNFAEEHRRVFSPRPLPRLYWSDEYYQDRYLEYAWGLSRQKDLADAFRKVITPLWEDVSWMTRKIERFLP